MASVIFHAFNQVKNTGKVKLFRSHNPGYADGGQLRDFIYGPDAGELLVKLLFSREAGAFNIGTGTPSTIRSAVEYLAARFGKSELVEFGALQRSPSDPAVQLSAFARMRAVEVLPVPRGPENK